VKINTPLLGVGNLLQLTDSVSLAVKGISVSPVATGEGIQGYLQQEQDLNPEPFTRGLILSHVLFSRKFNYSWEWTRCSLENTTCKMSEICRIYSDSHGSNMQPL
jgi:hypothetical protein